MSSSSNTFLERRPGGVILVVCAGLEAAVQDAAEAVELAQHGTMPDAASAKLVVVGAGIGRATERGEGLQVLPHP